MANLSAADFRWDEYFWKTTVVLPSWQGFQSRRGPYGARDAESPSDGRVALIFAPEGRDDGPLRESELDLVRWAIDHEHETQRSLLGALLAEYDALRSKYAGFLQSPDQMPRVRDVGGFRSLIGLHGVSVHQVEKDGVPYVGFELGCTWDDEHGLGVLMHGTRVVEIGGADTAILLWMAESDAERRHSEPFGR